MFLEIFVPTPICRSVTAFHYSRPIWYAWHFERLPVRICKKIGEYVISTIISVVLVQTVQPQTRKKSYPLAQFNNEGCMSKGRVQDCSGAAEQKNENNHVEECPTAVHVDGCKSILHFREGLSTNFEPDLPL
jgi:hypothetical protein